MKKPDQLSIGEIKKLKQYYADRWIDPVKRAEDLFNVRRADGSLISYKVPEPQKQILRDGLLGKSNNLVGSGVSYVSVTNKGRQSGFSVMLAVEAIMIAEDFPDTFIYYVATASDQASDWMHKLHQLIEDANHWPSELGGGSMINIVNIKKVFEKNINGTLIIGLSANPSAIRGKTGIHVLFDEAAWAIRFKDQAKETWKALKYIIRQGGSARIQSTPRMSDTEELFWGMYEKGEEGNLAIHTYTCPVIENWKELDLDEPLWIDLNNKRRANKKMKFLSDEDRKRMIERYKNNPAFIIEPGDYIKQKAEIPYWWISLEDLETDRATDLQQFKQENLGVPLDETYKLIKTEWIYSNINEGDEIDDRGTSTNKFYILIDLAQKNDITAITVIELIDGIYVERRIEETQAEYPVQVDLIIDLFFKFRPEIISIDNTGHGIVVGDMLEKALRDNSFNPAILKRVNFNMLTKEQMAVGFRNLVMPDPITGKSRYRWLKHRKKHEDAIDHCRRVEKEILPQGGIRYSGKMYGRDDHFWSKAQIALIEIPTGVPKAAFGRFKKRLYIEDNSNRRNIGKETLDENNKLRIQLEKEDIAEKAEVNRMRREKIEQRKKVTFALNCVTQGIVLCKTAKKPVKPIYCAFPTNCNNKFCPGYKYIEEICQRYGVTKNELWKQQRVY